MLVEFFKVQNHPVFAIHFLLHKNIWDEFSRFMRYLLCHFFLFQICFFICYYFCFSLIENKFSYICVLMRIFYGFKLNSATRHRLQNFLRLTSTVSSYASALLALNVTCLKGTSGGCASPLLLVREIELLTSPWSALFVKTWSSHPCSTVSCSGKTSCHGFCLSVGRTLFYLGHCPLS